MKLSRSIQILFCIGVFFFCTELLFAQGGMKEVLPNTSDDANQEYVDIMNTGCTPLSLSGYTLEDASMKRFTLSDITLWPGETTRLDRPMTKIILNNEDETLRLYDSIGTIIDSWSWKSSIKDASIIRDIPLEDCSVVSDTGSTLSGSENTFTGEIDGWSGGSTESGMTLSWTTASGFTETGVTHSGMTESGSHFNTWETNSGSLSGTTLTGSTPIFTGSIDDPLGESCASGPLVARSLLYRASDKNRKIDTLEITYDAVLTGILSSERIFLYSKTGGLSHERIGTLSWYVISGSLSGKILILRIREGDREKTELSVNNTTSSDLRLKSQGDLWITDLCGTPISPFFLTSSFDEYTRVMWENQNVTPPVEVGSSWSETPEENLSRIDLRLQHPSNVTLSGSIFFCPSDAPCRLNMNLEETFSGKKVSDFRCSIMVNSGTAVESCNPGTISVQGSGIIIMRIEKKGLTGTLIEEQYFYDTPKPVWGSPAPWWSPSIQSENHPPRAQIDVDTKWKSYYEFRDGVLFCYTNTCSINFTGENSTDPDGERLTYLWIWGTNDVSSSRDPGSRKYVLGDHVIKLRVIDARWLWDEARLELRVMGTREKEKTETEDLHRGEEEEIIFPEVLLETENKSVRNEDWEIFCETKTNVCKLNFTFTGGIKWKWVTYEWLFPTETIAERNPKSYSFPFGETLLSATVESREWKRKTYEIRIHVMHHRDENPLSQEQNDVIFPVLLLQTKNKNIRIEDGRIFCATKKDFCSLNFTLTGWIKGKWVQYLWEFPNATIEKRNPGSEDFPLGETLLHMQVIAPDGTMQLYERVIIVSKIVTRKEIPKWKILWFPLPYLETKSKNIRIVDDTIFCETKTDSCKLNFAFTGGIKWRWVKYEWDFLGKIITVRNPKSQIFPLWEHTLSMHVTYEKDGTSRYYTRKVIVSQKEDTRKIESNAPPEKQILSIEENRMSPWFVSLVLWVSLSTFSGYRLWRRKRWKQ